MVCTTPQVCLCGFRQLKDEDVQLLLDSCPSLTVLSVADCTTLGSLILFSRHLRTLDVSRCIHISEMSLEMPCKLQDVCVCVCVLRGHLICVRSTCVCMWVGLRYTAVSWFYVLTLCKIINKRYIHILAFVGTCSIFEISYMR